VVEQLPDLTRRAGLGPWTRLANRVQRLQLLALMGRNEEVLTEVQALRTQMATLAEQSHEEERVAPWNVRESMLESGRQAASNLQRWQEMLGFNAELIQSMQARGATAYVVVTARFNDYGPLLRLGELDEAERLLEACREVFEAERDLGRLGKTFLAQADLEYRRGHPSEAIRLQQTGLRYAYAAVDAEGIAGAHLNLATYLRLAGRDPAMVLAHGLASAFVCYRMDSGWFPKALESLAQDLAEAGGPPPLPGSFAELCERVGQVEGVRLAELAAQLPRRQINDDQVLVELVQHARTPREVTE
jgi:hypothetical protein